MKGKCFLAWIMALPFLAVTNAINLSDILWIIGIISFSGGVLSILSLIQIRLRYKKINYFPSHTQKASIIIPCKGKDENFEENIKSFLNQNYENYEVICVVDSPSDPSFAELERIAMKNQKMRVEISDLLESCSGKNSALLKGVKKSKDADVFVFADADIRPHKDWLSDLLAPLDDEKIGATTGYRWYFAHDITSLLLSVWNAAISSVLFYDILNFTWGGSTAIKKRIFEELKIAEVWKKSLVDDLSLTGVLKKNGYKIRLVPSCIVESYEEAGFTSLLKWATKQICWVKFYFSSLWKMAVILNVGLKFTNVFGLFIIFIGYPIPGILMFSPIIFDVFRGWLEFNTFKSLMNYPQNKFRSPFPHAIIRPFASFLITYNLISSIFVRKIEWGGRKYTLK